MWQPREAVRIATVTVAWKGGTVLAGRSLRLVEQRVTTAELIAGAAWLATLAAGFCPCRVALARG
jgi:hypothetical protein